MEDTTKLSYCAKFNHGDEVTSRITGLPMNGKVVAIFDPNYALSFLKSIHIWDEKFPGWRQDPVYIVRFNTPQRTISFEEFMAQINDSLKDDIKAMKTKYEMIPLQTYASYVEKDLEII